MAGVSMKDFAQASVMDFKKFGQVWPVTMDAEILERLDNCARKAMLHSRFQSMTSLADVRCAVFDLMEARAFRRQFLINFSEIIPAIVDAVNHRGTLDDLTQYDPTGDFRQRLSKLVPA